MRGLPPEGSRRGVMSEFRESNRDSIELRDPNLRMSQR